MGRIQATLRSLAGLVALGLCVLGGGALANTPVTTLADGRVGRVSFVVPAGDSTLVSLLNGTYASGDVIWGDLLMPERVTGPVPAMVISHGSRGVGPASYEWAELFAGMGVAAFVMDHFGGRGFSSAHLDQSLISAAVVPGDALLAAFSAVPFTGVSLATVGTMRLRFADGENGTLSYTYDGAPVTKAITRQVFASPVPLCN